MQTLEQTDVPLTTADPCAKCSVHPAIDGDALCVDCRAYEDQASRDYADEQYEYHYHGAF
jgi:hypothetical protein